MAVPHLAKSHVTIVMLFTLLQPIAAAIVTLLSAKLLLESMVTYSDLYEQCGSTMFKQLQYTAV